MPIIHRGPLPTDRFTIIENAWVRDSGISFRARGILVFIVSHEPGFEINLASMRNAREGRDAIDKALDELTDAGYLRRRRIRRPSGAWGAYEWFVQDPADQC